MRIFGHRPPITAWIGAGIILLNLVAAVFAPWLAPYGEAEVLGAKLQSPSAEHWFGTDQLGRDLFSRMLYGARNSIGLALLITLLNFAMGVTAGFAAAISGRWVDTALSRFADLMLSMPTLIFAFVVLSTLGTNLVAIILTIAVLEAVKVYRLARTVALGIGAMEFVEAARLRGEGLGWIIGREILPNALPPLVAEFGLRFCFAFLFVAALSFLGLGLQPPAADWGNMVRPLANTIFLGYYGALVPAGAIAILTVGVNFVVDWLLSLHSRSHGGGA